MICERKVNDSHRLQMAVFFAIFYRFTRKPLAGTKTFKKTLSFMKLTN